MLAGASKTEPSGAKIGARSTASVIWVWRRVRTSEPLVQKWCSKAASVTQSCSGTRFGLPTLTVLVLAEVEATKAPKSSWPTKRSNRTRTWVLSSGDQVSSARGLV